MRPSDLLSIPYSISGKSEVGKKQRGPDLNRVLIDEGNSVSNPFSKIVLKEKKEEKKEIKTEKKKPGEIVHGYNPSLSFADILSSYEKTGDPYRMPKKSASTTSSSFGDILDEWENGKPKEKKKKEIQREENKSSYKATRSFASILDEYEGVYRKEEAKKNNRKNTSDASSSVDNLLRGSTMFIEESEDDKVADNVSWSVIGGANKNYVRKEEKTPQKKEYKRTSSSYTPSSSFGSLLDEYEKKKANTVKKEDKMIPQPPKEENAVSETTFFIENEEEKVPDSVSWSVLGGANINYVRREPEKKEEEKPVKEEKKEIKRVSKPYTPKKSFAEILSSYSKEKKKTEVPEVEPEKEEKEDAVSPDEPFFMKSDDTPVPDTVSWSIIGGANPDYVRKEGEKQPEEIKDKEKKETRENTRVSEPYSPSSSFSDILSAYEEKKTEKTFSQIMEEKGDNRKKKASLTINELRRMGVQATLDLHGETQKDSGEMISSFLNESYEHGLRKVSIITGKGLHSETGSSVLRDLAFSLLSGSPIVQEVSPAPLTRGGSGALWVILREKSE